jgi:DNA polymerase-3 subunit delta
VAAAPEYDGGRPKGRPLSAKLQAAVAKAGAVVLCDPPAPSDLKSRATDIARARGKTIDAGALEVLARTAVIAASDRGGGKGGDLLVLHNELEKVIAYVGGNKRITRADALAVCARGTEENIFGLLDAVGHKNAARALDQVEELLRGGERPDSVAARAFVMLSRQLRMIWGARYLGDQRARPAGEEPQDVLSSELLGLTSRQSYALRSLQEQARSWTEDGLRRAVARVLASDMSLKGVPPITAIGYAQNAGADPAGNLRALVVDLCEL